MIAIDKTMIMNGKKFHMMPASRLFTCCYGNFMLPATMKEVEVFKKL